MSSNPLLRFRRSAAQLHALAEVERTIRASDTKCRRKYLRDFSEAFRTYRRVLSVKEYERKLAEANTILVGDYHALPASQRFTAALIERIVALGKPVVLGVEAIVARDQHILDEWQRHEIDSDELRSRIRFESDWGYDWQPFRELLERARLAGVKIFGVDCTPRQDMRSIRARDRHAAVKIASMREAHPDAVAVVLFGESHLAPNHLTKLVRELRPEDKMLTLLQNVDTLYWLSAGEPQDLVEVVEVKDDVVCVFSATPLEKYEHYRLCIERWKQQRSGTLDLAPSFYNLISSLFRFLNVNPYTTPGSARGFLIDELPEVWSVSNEEQLERLLSRRMSTKAVELRRMVRHKGSWFVPERNVIVAHEFRMPWAAEQASRFVHHICRGGCAPSALPEDDFYVRVISAALAFLGSKILCPTRKLYDRPQLDADRQRQNPEAAQAGFTRAAYREVLDFVAAVYDGRKAKLPNRPLGQPNAEQQAVASTLLGNLLGSELYSAYIRGDLSKRVLRNLYFQDVSKPGAARTVFIQMMDITRRKQAQGRLRMVS